MIGLKRRRRREKDDDIELDMVPIMNMFLVLIPFLLMSASFFHLKVIHTSVPVLSSQKNATDSHDEKKNIKLTVIIEIGEKGLHLSAISDTAGKDVLDSVEKNMDKGPGNEWPMEKLGYHLKEIKAAYPESDTVIIIPGKEVLYETIIKTMDIARNAKEAPMFPKVVLSGKVT